ncbi:MAG: glycosyltransferase family 2 protein, partial [Gaiellaceae bacterium]
MPRLSVILVAYDAGPALVRCVQALAGEGDVQLIVVDNGAGGQELEAVEQLDGVELLSPGRNLGYAAGSNLGAGKAVGDVLVFLNPDTVARPGALPKLAAVLDDPEIGAAMPRLLLLEEPELLNSDGNTLHLTGLAWVGGHGRPAGRLAETREIPYASGAALAIRAELFRDLGGFTEELFLYHEDVELGWRVRLGGLRVVVAPGADLLHDYEFSRNPRKHYYLERNRLVFVLTAYSGRLLALVAPVLAALELAVAVRALREGWLRQKLAGWAWCVRHADWIRRHRRDVQAGRRVPDRDLAGLLSATIDPAVLD